MVQTDTIMRPVDEGVFEREGPEEVKQTGPERGGRVSEQAQRQSPRGE